MLNPNCQVGKWIINWINEANNLLPANCFLKSVKSKCHVASVENTRGPTRTSFAYPHVVKRGKLNVQQKMSLLGFNMQAVVLDKKK